MTIILSIPSISQRIQQQQSANAKDLAIPQHYIHSLRRIGHLSVVLSAHHGSMFVPVSSTLIKVGAVVGAASHAHVLVGGVVLLTPTVTLIALCQGKSLKKALRQGVTAPYRMTKNFFEIITDIPGEIASKISSVIQNIPLWLRNFSSELATISLTPEELREKFPLRIQDITNKRVLAI